MLKYEGAIGDQRRSLPASCVFDEADSQNNLLEAKGTDTVAKLM